MIQAENKRNTFRIAPQSGKAWQININHDELITRNIVNISPTGMAFKAPVRSHFEEGQRLHLTINMATDGEFAGSFDCEGKIVWAKNHQFGLEFSKVPQFFDALIMKAVHEYQMAPRRMQLENQWGFPAGSLRKATKFNEKKSLFPSMLNLILTGLISFALIFAIFIHQQNNTQYSLADIVEQAFHKRLTGPGK